MKEKRLVWRLKEQPTSESLRELVKDNLLTKDEAREILFSSETNEDRDKESLESEIKFLRELVEKLSNRSQIVEIIKEVEVPYRRYRWWNPYESWCSMSSGSSATTNTDTLWASNFSNIKTF